MEQLCCVRFCLHSKMNLFWGKCYTDRERTTNCDADNSELYGCLNKGCHIIAPVLKLEKFPYHVKRIA